jgi:hypothetical protein
LLLEEIVVVTCDSVIAFIPHGLLMVGALLKFGETFGAVKV